MKTVSLTRRQLEVLRIMRDQHEELVYERGQGYVGTEKIAPRTIFALLRACAVRISGDVGGLERYTINSTGKDLIA